MNAVPKNTLGGHVAAGTMKAQAAEALARAIFDGGRQLSVAGHVVIAPDFAKMTAHEQVILKGLFLKAEVRS